MTNSQKLWRYCYLAIILIALTLPIITWGQSVSWELAHLTLYQIFPLLGLLAFTVFWLQLISDALLSHWQRNGVPAEKFFARSSIFFMTFVILHPLLLAIGEFLENDTLPPASWLSYVGQSYQVWIIIAIISLIIFLFTEFTIRAKNGYFFNKFSRLINNINYVAFFFVFFHSIKLGQHVQGGLLHAVWWFYGITGALCIGVLLYRSYTKR